MQLKRATVWMSLRIRGLTGRVLPLFFATQRADGFLLVSDKLKDAVDSRASLAKVEEALHLISTYDPKRYKRIQRDIDRIIVFPELQGGEYFPELRACALGRTTVNEGPIYLASVIVHEATHARLWGRGGRYEEDERLRARVERLCTQAEVNFLRTVPDTEDIIGAVSHSLDKPWWGTEALAEMWETKAAAIGVPKWLRRLRRKWWSL